VARLVFPFEGLPVPLLTGVGTRPSAPAVSAVDTRSVAKALSAEFSSVILAALIPKQRYKVL